MSEHDKIELLSLWLEGKLRPEQQQAFAQLCLQDANFAKQVEQANHFQLMSETNKVEAVPDWNKDATFKHVGKKPWWQWEGLPAISMACSVFALVMVLTGFNLDYQDGRFSVGFGALKKSNTLAQADIEDIVTAQVQQYQRANQALLSQYLDAMQDQQLQNSAQLTEYVLTSSRQERREDFAEFIKFINQQRQDDQVFYARQLNDLHDEINNRSGQLLVPALPISDLTDNDE